MENSERRRFPTVLVAPISTVLLLIALAPLYVPLRLWSFASRRRLSGVIGASREWTLEEILQGLPKPGTGTAVGWTFEELRKEVSKPSGVVAYALGDLIRQGRVEARVRDWYTLEKLGRDFLDVLSPLETRQLAPHLFRQQDNGIYPLVEFYWSTKRVSEAA